MHWFVCLLTVLMVVEYSVLRDCSQRASFHKDAVPWYVFRDAWYMPTFT